MKFSIIIPVYNVEKYLAQCLDSVLCQTYASDYEIICVNDGSTDSSLVILEEYRKKHKELKIIDQQNKGLSGARNTGLKEAKGEYVWFVDSDDWIDKKSLEILAANISNEDMICFNGKRYFENGALEQADEGQTEVNMKGWDYYNKYALQPRKFHFVCVVLRLYKRDFLINKHLRFEERIYHEDNLFTPMACYYAQKVKVIPDILYHYRIRQGSITEQIKMKNLIDILLVANKLSEFFIPKTDIDKSVVYREISGEYFSVFMPDKAKIYNKNYGQIKQLIHWDSYKNVSRFPRHRRIYQLIKLNPRLLHWYLMLEKMLKNKLK